MKTSISPLLRTFAALLILAVASLQLSGCGAKYSVPVSNPSATPQPTFSPVAGTYTSTQNVAIADAATAAVIYYTLDGTTPTTTSPVYSTPLSIAATTTINAIAIAPNETASGVASSGYTITLPTVATPIFTPAAGTYSSTLSVTITDTTSGSTIYYTTDGSTPTTSSTVYSTPLTVAASTTINAIAVAANYQNSPVTTAQYMIVPPAVAAPVFTPVAGSYATTQNVTITDATPGATIYYTTNGGPPSSSSTVYTAPFPVSTTTTIRAIAANASGVTSQVTSATYTITALASAAPTFTPAAGTYSTPQNVTLADTTTGAVIYYTTDGSTPSNASTVYSTPIPISATATINAIAAVNGGPASPVSTATYTISLPANYQPTYTYKPVPMVGGGFVDGLYFHPAQQGLMYAHTDIGGAYRWNNVAGGDTQWVPLMDFIGRFNSGFDLGVQSLAIDPNDATKLYLAVGDYTESYGSDGAILISSNMGNTFTSVALPFKNGGNDNGRNDGDRLVVDPNNGQHLYLGTFLNGLYESLDGAQTWHQVSAFPIIGPTSNPEDPEAGVILEQFVASSGKAANGNTRLVYYGVSSPTTGFYVSQDGGVSFSAVPGQPAGYYPNAAALDTTNNILYVTYALNSGCTSSCDNSGPGSPNAGQVWSYALPTTANPNGVWTNITPPQTTPTGGAYGFDSVVVDPNHPNVIMVTTLNKYYPSPDDDVFRSADSGATWYNLGTNIVRDGSLSPWVAFGGTNSDGSPAYGPGNWLNHLVVDPFNSNHAMLGTGQTIWQTTDVGDADGVTTSTSISVHGNATHWSIGALGVEETDITALVSPPSGPAHLLSQMGDLGGFTHTDLTVSPANGQQRPPIFTTGTSIDFAQNNPLFVARVGTSTGTAGTFNQPLGSVFGAYSLDGGMTWVQFANNPSGVTKGAGTIAVAADGSTIVWMPSDVGVAAAYSTDNGTTWIASTGAPAQINFYAQLSVYADRVNPKKFYLFDPAGNSADPANSNGQTPIYVSTDGGHTFTLASTPSSYDISFAVSPNAEGDVWLTSYNGLFHSTDSGTTVTQVNGLQASYGIGFGAAGAGHTYPAIYLIGVVSSDTGCTTNSALGFTTQTQCVYRSIDGGATFVRINDFAHQYGSFNVITGDPRVFGRVYFGTGGRGIIEGDSPN